MDQISVFLLWRSWRNTLWTVLLVDLGDGPAGALSALGLCGPQNPGQVPLGLTYR